MNFVGIILLSLLISILAFREMPPPERAFHTVGLAWLIQTIVFAALMPSVALSIGGVVLLFLQTVWAAIVGLVAWLYWKRRWIDD